MIIVNINEIKKFHAANLVFDGLTLQIHTGDRVGLIGRNGSGKSTLLRLISGHDQVDEGMLTVQKDLQIGYLPQIPEAFNERTVYEVLAYGYEHLMASKKQMTDMEQQMSSPEAIADPAAMERLLKTYSLAQERFERDGGYEMDTMIDQVATGLLIDRSFYTRSFSSLSGGEKTKISLASQLIVRPALLLLDEPTNHLDLRGMEWLEQFLRQYEGACVIVSHDRYFLDAVSSKMIELEDGTAQTFHTNYTGYMKEKEELLLGQFAKFQEQQKQIKKMKETIKQLEDWGRIGGNEKFFKRAASIRKALEKLEMIKKPVLEQKTADFELLSLDRSGRRVIAFEGVTKRFGERVILDQAEGSLLYGEKVVLVGDNGSGKTTLFKLLLGDYQPDEGELVHGARVNIGYLAQEEKAENKQQSVLDFFRTEGGYEEGEARNVLAGYLFYGADVFKPIHALSGGEWSRLRLALLIRKKPNLLLLDEPTNHLDISSREALEEALEQFGGTVLAISHDRYFINRLAKRVWELKQGTIAEYLGNYDDFKARQQQVRANETPIANPAEKTRERKRVSEQPAHKQNAAETRSKSKQQLESEIAVLEAKLAELSLEMEQLAASGKDASRLEAAWSMQEQQQMQLDRLLEMWMEFPES
ncbi:ABC-F family ATP-binding cassette domain-containing protein [Bacillus sp. FJAT-26390]|uniref:ABC-F family ATP-binding cassette domain-containing protein n=1 Tax=Bacillus sp. FJAT-26390 TaxID=1743142 RepID=UPI0008080773|nr:ABC-F family ATP-binding cassette domain-containing protein [Bacillus sp. FJAT-26390]OBZ16042.1 ABC transporter ATP-binding protein [Bacillus sp. FJAT-26390]